MFNNIDEALIYIDSYDSFKEALNDLDLDSKQDLLVIVTEFLNDNKAYYMDGYNVIEYNKNTRHKKVINPNILNMRISLKILENLKNKKIDLKLNK